MIHDNVKTLTLNLCLISPVWFLNNDFFFGGGGNIFSLVMTHV